MNITIRAKLILIGVVATLSLFLLFVFSSYFNLYTSRLNHGLELLDHINSGLLLLRRNEKDFLARRDLKYRSQFETNYQKLSQLIDDSQTLFERTGLDTAHLKTIARKSESYHANFIRVTTVMEEIGLDEKSGLQGKFRDDVHAVEDPVMAQGDYKLMTDILMLRRREKDFLLRMDASYIDKFEKDYASAINDINASERIDSATKSQILDLMKDYRAGFLALAEGYKTRGLDASSGLLGTTRAVAHDVENTLATLSEETQKAITSKNRTFQIVFVIIMIGLVIIILGVIITTILAITRPVGRLVSALENVTASGDYTARVDVHGDDEIGKIAHTFNQLLNTLQTLFEEVRRVMSGVADGDLTRRMKESNFQTGINESVEMLQSLITRISLVSDRVKDSSGNLLSASRNLADGTTAQASSLEEIASTIQEIESQAKNNNTNAETARLLIDKTNGLLVDGNQKMSELSASMSDINVTSNNVTKIIKEIDEIAFQTNLLALNAAVEAARAGQYGKGFAVVAEEVRSLANRSAVAAKDTTELIETSIGEVEKGVRRSDDTAAVLRKVTSQIEEMAQLISDITHSSGDQAIGIGQVNDTLSQINTTVQRNAAISEKTASTSEELLSESSTLRDIIDNFKLDAQTTPQKKEPLQPTKPVTTRVDPPSKPKPLSLEAPSAKTNPSRKNIILDDDNFGKY